MGKRMKRGAVRRKTIVFDSLWHTYLRLQVPYCTPADVYLWPQADGQLWGESPRKADATQRHADGSSDVEADAQERNAP